MELQAQAGNTGGSQLLTVRCCCHCGFIAGISRVSQQTDGGSHSKQPIKNEVQNISPNNYYYVLILFEITILLFFLFSFSFFILAPECSLNI